MRIIEIIIRWLMMISVAALLFSGCSFDGTSLENRQCSIEDENPCEEYRDERFSCIDGFCQTGGIPVNNETCEGGEINACGGCGPLTQELGGNCGICGKGVLICDPEISGQLSCRNEEQGINACGGCGDLIANPGDSCGACGDGTYACNGVGLVCTNASATNACGGCHTLEESEGDRCGACGLGFLLCDEDSGDLTCNDADRGVNACGGCAPLDDSFSEGSSCGTCNSGIWQCTNQKNGICADEDTAAQNVCGGCQSPPEDFTALSTRCGTCGVWSCTEEGSIHCEEPENCPATCAENPFLGERCGRCNEGTYSCDAETLICEGSRNLDELNACNGCSDPPSGFTGIGQTCNTCGEWRCNNGDIICSRADASSCPTRCEDLEEVGTPCGLCNAGQYVCEENRLVCNLTEDPRNICGGCEELPAEELGAQCEEDCRDSEWYCTEDLDLQCRIPESCTPPTCTPLPCGVNLGICQEGTQKCVDNQLQADCTDAEGEMVSLPGDLYEVCDDQFDNDCDGNTDEDDCLCGEDGTPQNSCGGCGELSGEPGDPCGTCDSGTWGCNQQGTVTCQGDQGSSALNACNGCGELVGGEPNTPCGTCNSGTWTCDNTGTRTTCDGAHEETIGDPCSTGLDGLCSTGTWACAGTEILCQQDHQASESEQTCDDDLDDDCDGMTDQNDPDCQEDPCENPPEGWTCAQGLLVQIHEVSVHEYDSCVNDTDVPEGNRCTPRGDQGDAASSDISNGFDCHTIGDFPANCLRNGTEDASKYCAYIGARLPTQEELTAIGTNGGTTNFPWGDETATCDYTNMNQCFGSAVPRSNAQTFAAGNSSEDVRHLMGNVWEYVTCTNDARDCICGGGGTTPFPEEYSCATVSKNSTRGTIGIRCVKDL